MKQDRDTKIGERAKAIVKAKASMEALRKAQAAPKRPMPKEPTTGGSDTVPMTSDRADFLKEMAKRNAAPGMKKGGKAKANPFGATKFGSAMMKKSADTKGRAMVKKAGGGKCYASGGKVKKMAFGGTSLPSRVASSLNKTLKPRTPSVIGPSANKANAIANSDKLQQGAAAKAAQASSTASAPAQAPTNIGRLNMGHAKGGKVKKMAIGGIPAGASTTVLRPPIMSGSPNAPTMQPVTSGARVANTRTAAVSRRAEGGTAKVAKSGKATKFGKALVKKSADTMGRAMVKKAGGGKCYASGGSVSSASKRADGCAVKGKTRCKGARK
jgi:hypothetical protein